VTASLARGGSGGEIIVPKWPLYSAGHERRREGHRPISTPPDG
jgi:hypothetical protein